MSTSEASELVEAADEADEVGEASESGQTESATENLRDCPPSAKLVAKVLEYDGPLTQSQIADESLLPTRTVRYALSRLDDADVVESRFSFTDARKRVYRLAEE